MRKVCHLTVQSPIIDALDASGFLAAERKAIRRVMISGMQAFAPNVWIIDGLHERDMGVMFTTCTTVVQLANSWLWVDSPVLVSFEMLKRITEPGTLGDLVDAIPRYVWWLKGWHTLFPAAQLNVSRPTPFTGVPGNVPKPE